VFCLRAYFQELFPHQRGLLLSSFYKAFVEDGFRRLVIDGTCECPAGDRIRAGGGLFSDEIDRPMTIYSSTSDQ